MPRPQSKAPRLQLVRAISVTAAQELLGAPTIGGGSAHQGMVVEGVKEVK
jgi:hypothetical protein